MLCCEIQSCHAHRHNDLGGHSSFLITIYSFFFYLVLGTLVLWRSTVVFTYLKVKSAKCLLFTSGGLGLVISVFVL